jgi:tRNA(Ile)-lysidine synthase
VTIITNTGKNTFPKDTDPKAFFDLKTLTFPLVLRPRRPGDCFHPLGAPGPMKLKKFLINRKVPKNERGGIRVLCSGNKIAWVVGHRISELFKVRPETRRIAAIALRK